ncbi:hypothetical protein HMPREF2720_04775 [Staphylococcus sp. HMSC074C02]|uniref:hypothetical protein n=1 Tax=Staphylococcus sp. HMSC074C02 TaxID=1715199 RepID=UPI0008A3AB0D|nr:hypothetical protein [Staphylococcus sp. HMSC074C02]OFM09942.1 hypothetical protein HMPREF2720_04775 [Staphylococcus sp. HMSC074C02]
MKDNTEQMREQARKYFDSGDEEKQRMEDEYIEHSKEFHSNHNMIPPDEEVQRKAFREIMQEVKEQLL